MSILLRSGDDGYDEARKVWNGAIDRRPAAIARVTSAADVAQALRFARDQGLEVTVRGGGHSVAGLAVQDDAMMIDLSAMRHVHVDPQAKTATVGGGALLSDLDRATQEYGLATTGGVVSHTGVGGLTLGGGIGHLMRRFGLTVDNLLAAELVTANGDRLDVDAEREPELFWGLRGGGGNFGVVTKFTYRLHEVGPTVLGGPVFWPLTDAPKVLAALVEYAQVAPDELSLGFTVRYAPPAPFLAPEHHGKAVVGLLLVWTGDPAAGEAAMAPLRHFGTPVGDGVRPQPYTAIQSMLDASSPHGAHYYWRAHRLPTLTIDDIDTFVAAIESSTSPMSHVVGLAVGGAVSRVDAEATAVGPREPGFEANVVAAWQPGEDPEPHRKWVRAQSESLRPRVFGLWSHFLSDEGADGVRLAYQGRMDRLTLLKDRYDPHNVFRFNANIAPARRGSGQSRAANGRHPE
ncbi:FAD-binding oxidoreductase [Tenggerimyces flavus]|uniref:FAD-binding oxidoreductase n=1 Tax=Tenggerimyces flavus TaxID=1708749 RepID=A0ABV7YCX7_9ACTN|nr:FAD-binding oxidoreductase [Tenggerimyces flavus]MBM7787165.1 FAD/FMN-containing dehydrogenase [Tenggerimyces flavus]